MNSRNYKKRNSWLAWGIPVIVVAVLFFSIVGMHLFQSSPPSEPGRQTEYVVLATPLPTPTASQHFVIATDKGFSPFEFQDAQGNIVGIDMDILAAIAEDQGFTYDLQYIGWDAAIAACQAGQADGMIAGVTITQARKDNGWIFSDGYYDATQGMAVAADSSITGFADLAGKKVAVKDGTMSKQYAESIKDQYGFEVVTFPASPDMYRAVMDGQVDACIDDTPILRYTIKDNQLPMKYVEGTENEPDEYGMAVFDPDNQELIDLFNAGLKNIRANGTYDRILAKYLG